VNVVNERIKTVLFPARGGEVDNGAGRARRDRLLPDASIGMQTGAACAGARGRVRASVASESGGVVKRMAATLAANFAAMRAVGW
jgi:hypothetical protein